MTYSVTTRTLAFRAALVAVLVAVLGMALALLGLAPAQAHSDTFQSVPAAGSTSASVTQLQFTFAEPVQKTMSPEVVLSASGGVNVPVSAPTFDVTGATMTVGIPSGALPNGSYAAVYRVVSIDGHVASGVLNFTVAGSTAQPVTGSPTASVWTAPGTPTTSGGGLDIVLITAAIVVGALVLGAGVFVVLRRR